MAIVGLGAAFPGAPDADAFWRLVCEGRDATTEVPPGRWLLDPERAFAPEVARTDRVYTTRGGFLADEALEVDCAGLDVDPSHVARLDPCFRLALRAAVQAWRSARTEAVDRSRVGVVFGHIVLPTETTSALTRATIGRRIEEALCIVPNEAGEFEPQNAFPAGAPARLISMALGLDGSSYTIDAACASSLYAIKLACDELLFGRADAMIAGGVSRPDALYTQMGFSQLRALSPRGRAAPFDAEGDGLIVGEGAGLFVLKRLEDAIEQVDTILGVIRGVGVSNDVRGDLLAPSSEGQLRAMRSAYEQAGWSPADVDLIECHATGTPVGDAVEFESLRALWSDLPHPAEPGRCTLGSVKSNVGHALTAAGAAGLLKVLLAFRRRVLPPVANHRSPSEKVALEGSPFRILQVSEPWPTASDRPRRAAISGFGFGGINAHLLIEEWTGVDASVDPVSGSSQEGRIAIVGLAARWGGESAPDAFAHRVLGGSASPEASPSRLEELRIRLGRFRIPPRELEEMLLQQSLTLQVAADAIDDAKWSPDVALRSSVLVGLNLDLNTTNYHLRWWLAERAPAWNVEHGWGLSDEELQAWVSEACDAIQPALTANRTMGSLGGLVASRIAREFGMGGPSFSVSSDERSGVDALAIAADWLGRGEIDSAVVAAVDLTSDPRLRLAAEPLVERWEDAVGDCSVAVVLKRYSDAVRDGDHVYAIVGGEPGPTISVEEPRRSLGWTGAAAGLATAVTAALATDRRIVPPSSLWGRLMRRPSIDPSYWPSDRSGGPRTARVAWRRGIIFEVVESHRADEDRQRPLGPAPVAVFPVYGGLTGLDRLAARIAEASGRPIEQIAADWWASIRGDERRGPALAFVAEDPTDLAAAVAVIRSNLGGGGTASLAAGSSVEVFEPVSLAVGEPPKVAFTYPGLGAARHQMGAELSARFPELMREFEARYDTVARQFAFDYWADCDNSPSAPDHRPAILGQISVGSLMTALFLKLGVQPSAAVGYSLGESAALVALGAWDDRDEMTRRLTDSPLFREELAGPCLAARRVWGLADDEPVDWVAALVPRSREQAEAAIGDEPRVYVLIRNTADEVVIGGRRDAVHRVLDRLQCPSLPLPAVSTVHCPIGKDVEESYRTLHELKATHLAGVTFYSGVWGTGYLPDHGTATAAITAQASRMIDYPAVVDRAYAEGIRIFVEMGPGAGCTRLVDRILGDRPHLAVSADEPGEGALRPLFRVVGSLLAAGVPVDLDFLYLAGRATDQSTTAANMREILIERRDTPLRLPVAPARRSPAVVPETEIPAPMPDPTPIMPPTTIAGLPPLTRGLLESQQAAASAHEVFLRLSRSYFEMMGGGIAALMEPPERTEPCGAFPPGEGRHDAKRSVEGDVRRGVANDLPDTHEQPVVPRIRRSVPPSVARQDGRRSGDPAVLDRPQCLEYAIGSIGKVLGPRYAEIDSYPTRVRLPDEPLMLVDRIMSVEGTQFELGHGRVVTEHDVLHDGWYLDGGRIAACVAIEAGQADLFLSGWLGIDFVTKGMAVYRLLDATVTFHRPLPGPGAVINYDIKISGFFRQGETHLFRFEFVGTVDGEPLLTMKDGCAGFFSAGELAAGKGVVPRPLDAAPRPGKRPEDWRELAPASPCTLDRRQVDALRAGDLAAAFGPPFDRLDLPNPFPLPGGLLTLVHRVGTLDPKGGRFGLGLIRAEADVRPDDWFIVCHFVDDRVMPGTLMYECCLHTFRIFLTRLGWVGASDRVRFEPLPGVANRLRCRGQVTESTRVVTYEVTVKELGYGPEPFAIADALMYADGKPIVEVSDMAIRLAGTSREEIEALWDRARSTPSSPALVYDKNQIVAFAEGNPSACFGDRYRPFDEGRFIARLPRPPYQFMDRASILEGCPWEQAVGTTAEVVYDAPPDAWYFEADRQPRMPYAVLLEAALQPCGFVSAFMGSALLSDEPLKFRNLGGRATQHRVVGRDSGPLTTTARVTKINRSAGMIIQNYEMTVRDREGIVLEGDTYFGFFHPQALANQVGMPDVSPYVLTDQEREAARSFDVPDRLPLPDRRWRMVDRITALVPSGGPNGLGIIAGETDVDPSAWFFQAHFLGDPVWPGSLGLESLLQLLKVFAEARWGLDARAVFDSPGVGAGHEWVYRGQIAPGARLVSTQAWITGVDDARRRLTADGVLSVDGRVIYRMSGYTLDVRPD